MTVNQTTARDVMFTRFTTVSPEDTVSEAALIFRQATRQRGHQVYGLMVTDPEKRLVGMLSMYDILLLIRPKHIHVWGMMDDIDITGMVERACRRAKSIRVGDIMSTDLISVDADTHMLTLIDLMINKHVRRIPVLDGDKILGIVYLQDLFDDLVDKIVFEE